MAIQIELSPEVEARLAAEAEQQGVTAATYAERLLIEALAPAPPAGPRATPEKFTAFLDALAGSTRGADHLADSTFFREMIYDSHD